MRKEILLLLFFSLISISYAFPQSMDVNIEDITPGTYTFNFSITQGSDCSSPAYTNISTLTVGSLGRINYTLTGINIDFSQNDYYFCYYRDGVLKSKRQIGQAPYADYARRANYSLISNNTYFLNGLGYSGFCKSNGTDCQYINNSWNETRADQKYALIGSSGNASWNQSYADTLYATIGSNGGNASWNETRADQKYASIIFGYNMSSPFYSWLSTFAYNYNETSTTITYLNSTYGYSWKNWTGEANQTIFNTYDNRWSSTYNLTYNNLIGQTCTSGQVMNGTYANGSIKCQTVSAVASMDYTNIAMRNDTNTFTKSQTFSNITNNGDYMKSVNNEEVYGLTRTLPSSINGTVALGTFDLNTELGEGNFEVTMTSSTGGYVESKKWIFSVDYGLSNSGWVIVAPVSTSSDYLNMVNGATGHTLEIQRQTSGTIQLNLRIRAVELIGSGQTVYITIKKNGRLVGAFTPSTTTGTDNTQLYYYPNNFIEQFKGNIYLHRTTSTGATNILTDSNNGIIIENDGTTKFYNNTVKTPYADIISLKVPLRNNQNESSRFYFQTIDYGAGQFDMWVTVMGFDFSQTKRYILPTGYDRTSAQWKEVVPIYSSANNFNGNNFEIDLNSSALETSIRIRREGNASNAVQHYAYITLIPQAGLTIPALNYQINTTLQNYTSTSTTTGLYGGTIIKNENGVAYIIGNLSVDGISTIRGNTISNGTASFTLQELNATGSGSGNASWNESRANTLYSEIKWNYNQTYSGSTFNSTYNTWSYNQSKIYETNPSSYYNITTLPASSGNASWNQSYAETLFASIVFGYNMTTPFTNWLSTFAYNYNETSATITYLNSTYGYSWKNWTGEANQTIFNTYDNRWSSTYNSSYIGQNASGHAITKIWCGNITGGTDADFCTDSGGSVSNDGIKIKIENITNIPSCTSGQFLTNVSGIMTCATPSSSSSTTSIYVSNNVSTNATGLTFVNLFNITTQANKNYSIECILLHASNATTSGIRYNISLNNAPDFMMVAMDAFTSATAKQNSVVSGASKSLMPTAVTASLAYPSFLETELEIFIDGNANTGGNAILQFSGELANLRAVVGKGSYCKSEEVS